MHRFFADRVRDPLWRMAIVLRVARALLLAIVGQSIALFDVAAQESGHAAVSAVSERNILAISWQPAFCETRPRVRECASQSAARADATQFSLHGLWPQPRSLQYCGLTDEREGRSRNWRDLPAVELSAATRAALAAAMPGTQSGLERYQWMKHGTCFGASPEAYFSAALALLEQVNASPVRKLFADSIGKTVSAAQVRAAFDAGFGKGVGERVRLSCRNDGDRRIIVELTIGLVGGGLVGGGLAGGGAEPSLAALALASRSIEPGCLDGVVDAVGTG